MNTSNKEQDMPPLFIEGTNIPSLLPDPESLSVEKETTIEHKILLLLLKNKEMGTRDIIKALGEFYPNAKKARTPRRNTVTAKLHILENEPYKFIEVNKDRKERNRKYRRITEKGVQYFVRLKIDKLSNPLNELQEVITNFPVDLFRKRIQEIDNVMAAQDKSNQSFMDRQIKSNQKEIILTIAKLQFLIGSFSGNIRTFEGKQQLCNSKGETLKEKPSIFNDCSTCMHRYAEYAESPCRFCTQKTIIDRQTGERQVEKPTQWQPKSTEYVAEKVDM